MRTLVPSSEYSSSVISNGSFYRLLGKSDEYRRVWCCDAFTVDSNIRDIATDDGQSPRKIMEYLVVFHSPTGDKSFSWCLTSLRDLSFSLNNSTVLHQTLSDFGVRCSPGIDSTNAIINAILNPAITFYEGR